MKELLAKNLYSKHKLTFNKEGKFKILMFSDVQEREDFDSDTLRNIKTMIDRVNPDLIILGGDQCMGPDVCSKEKFKIFLSKLVSPLEERKIPWVHIYGNHDHDLDFDPFEQQALYEEYPFCVSKHTTEISGVTNFMLPIYKYDSESIGFNIWGLDTHRKKEEFISEFGVEGYIDVENKPSGVGRYDLIRFDQMMWYWNSSVALEKFANGKIPSLMCMHIAPIEFASVINNPEQCGLIGNGPERLDSGFLNSGIFSEILQRGDVCCISCAHTHRNNFEASFCGIKVCFDSTAGMTCYGEEETRGGRIFEIDENDPWHIVTYPYYYKDNK